MQRFLIMTKQKKIRRTKHYYDERIEETDVQARERKPSRSIYGRAAKKPWQWAEYIKLRLKNY